MVFRLKNIKIDMRGCEDMRHKITSDEGTLIMESHYMPFILRSFANHGGAEGKATGRRAKS